MVRAVATCSPLTGWSLSDGSWGRFEETFDRVQFLITTVFIFFGTMGYWYNSRHAWLPLPLAIVASIVAASFSESNLPTRRRQPTACYLSQPACRHADGCKNPQTM